MDTNHLPTLENLPLKEQVQRLVKVRAEVEKQEQVLAEAKAQKKEINEAIMFSLKAIGSKTFKNETHSVSIVSRSEVKIIDESLVIEFFKKNRTAKKFVEKVERLNEFAPKFVEELVNDGKEVAGTEIRESEWVSVRSTEKKVAKPEMTMSQIRAKIAKDRGKNA